MHVNIVCGLYTIFYIKNYVTGTYCLTIYHYPYVHNIKMKDGLDDEVAVQVSLFEEYHLTNSCDIYGLLFWTGQLRVYMLSAHFL